VHHTCVVCRPAFDVCASSAWDWAEVVATSATTNVAANAVRIMTRSHFDDFMFCCDRCIMFWVATRLFSLIFVSNKARTQIVATISDSYGTANIQRNSWIIPVMVMGMAKALS
jgi:hypothetical protein